MRLIANSNVFINSIKTLDPKKSMFSFCPEYGELTYLALKSWLVNGGISGNFITLKL